MQKAYLHFGTGSEPRQTIGVDAKETPLPRTYRPVHGYGVKIATEWLVRWRGRWRRVYAAVWGNSPSFYIGEPGAWLATVSLPDREADCRTCEESTETRILPCDECGALDEDDA